MTLKDH